MKISERYALEIGQIESDIETLKNRQIREIQGAGPYSSVASLGLRLEDEFKNLIAILGEKMQCECVKIFRYFIYFITK